MLVEREERGLGLVEWNASLLHITLPRCRVRLAFLGKPCQVDINYHWLLKLASLKRVRPGYFRKVQKLAVKGLRRQYTPERWQWSAPVLA